MRYSLLFLFCFVFFGFEIKADDYGRVGAEKGSSGGVLFVAETAKNKAPRKVKNKAPYVQQQEGSAKVPEEVCISPSVPTQNYRAGDRSMLPCVCKAEPFSGRMSDSYVGFGESCLGNATSTAGLTTAGLTSCVNNQPLFGGPLNQQVCNCESPNEAEKDDGILRCIFRETVSKTVSSTEQSSSAAAESDSIESCFFELQKKVEACKSQGVDAVKNCDKENTESNSGWSEASKYLNLGAQLLQAKAGKSGSAEQCFDAGMLSTATWAGMEKLSNDCSKHIESCEGTCTQAQNYMDNIENNCKAHFAHIENTGSAENLAAFRNLIQTKVAESKKELAKGDVACNKTAKKDQDILAQSMKRMNDAAQQAAQCNCQLTTGIQMNAEGKCENIQGPEYCAEHPGDINCPAVVDSTIPYVPGGENPMPVVSKPTNPGGSTVAGGFTPIAAGGPSFKSSGGLGGNLDFGNDSSGSLMSGDKSQGGPDSPFGSAAGGGGGGGGGSPSGGGEGGAPYAGDEPESKGIAGLFNNLKTGIANAFGGGSGGKNSGDGKNFGDRNKNGKTIDPESWRPTGLRGIAGGSGMGTKNMDLFKMIQIRYGDQYHTLITVESQNPK